MYETYITNTEFAKTKLSSWIIFFFVGPKIKMCPLIEVYNSGLLSLSPTLIYHLINGLIIVRILVRSVSIENYYCYRNYFRRDKININ